MSAICGVASLDGRPLEEQTCQEVLAALAHRGPDGSATWVSRGVMLGHQSLRVTPQSSGEVLPWADAEARVAITADARLDNRDDLCASLDIGRAERATIPDSQLILHAWRAWGDACPQRLEGTFAFAIWDAAAARLFCSRDPMGQRSLYYFHDERRFVFASEAKGIFAAGVPRRLNAARLAALASREARFGMHEQTFYEGVYSLPAGASLSVDASGLRQRTYWTPDNDVGWPYRSDEDAFDALRALMTDVVRAHTRSAFPMGALLSGGLDSSSVVSLAARSLAAEGKTLTTFSAVLPEGHAAGLRDEREFMDEFRAWPSVAMRHVACLERGPFDDLERITRQAESPLMSSRHYLYAAFAQAAREAGIRVLLDGAWGELGPSSHARGYYAELFVRREWRTLARELAQRSRADERSILRLVLSQVLAPLGRLVASGISHRRTAPAARVQSAMTAEFVATHLESAATPADAMLTNTETIWPDSRRNERRVAWAAYRKHARPADVFAGYEQVEMRYPFADPRLLSFCLAAPRRLKVRNGYARYLLRGSLQGILPESIRWRTSKTPFSPDYHRRYAEQREQALAVLDDMAPRDPVRAVVDVKRLRRWLDRATPLQALGVVPQGIYLIFFLRQFADFRP